MSIKAIKSVLKSIFQLAMRHKIIAVIVAVVVICGGYFGYHALAKSKDNTQYLVSAVTKGTLIVSVSGSGQVLSSDQVEIKPKVSGDIVSVSAAKGDQVPARQLLAIIDTSEAAKSVRNAQTSLETANLEYDKLIAPPDELTLLQSENSLEQAKESIVDAQNSLAKTYEDSFNTIANSFLDLPNIATGLQDILFSTTLSQGGQWNLDYYVNSVKAYDASVVQFRTDAYEKYQKARITYDKNFLDYKAASRFSEKTVIENLVTETYETAKDIAEAVKSASNLIQFYQDKLAERSLTPSSFSNTHLSSLNTYTSKTNSLLSNLLSAKQSLQDAKQAIVNAQRSFEEKTLSLNKIKAGADDLEIRAAKIAIQQAEDNLQSSQETLANCYIRAPFDGILASFDIKKGDSVSAGTAAFTLISKNKLAEITLNEIDAAKVKTGQKATLTLDAVPDLEITGHVFQVDTLGTVSQGVVSYTIQIAFDTQDERVKSGMSVSAGIIVDAVTDVLMVPNASVKSQGDSYYVQMPSVQDAKKLSVNSVSLALSGTLKTQPIEIGIANDDYTQITSGLQEGDIVITGKAASKTTGSASSGNNQQSGGSFRMPGF